MIKGPVAEFVSFYLVQDRDCDNLRLVLDVLEGKMISNDRQADELHVLKEKDRQGSSSIHLILI